MRFLHSLAIVCFFLLIVTLPVSAISLSGPSTVVAGDAFALSISNGDLLGTITLSLVSGESQRIQLLPGQVGVSGSVSSATVELDSNGRARVEYTTTLDAAGSNCRFTVTGSSGSDSTTVAITSGKVTETIAPAPTQAGNTYAIGSEIPLSGSAPGSSKVYLFIVGPNLPSSGGKLSSPMVAAVTGDPSSFVSRSVDSNGRWSYNWMTRGTLDAGTYTIFVVDRPANLRSLSDASYSTYTVRLGRPSMSASISDDPIVTAVPTVTPTPAPTEVPQSMPTVIESIPTPTVIQKGNLWDIIMGWFSGVFQGSS